jgi:predicted house-cleaning noncanonical NTP pyrophosphatase (MazG superfamily)
MPIIQAPEMQVNQSAGVKGFHIKAEHKLFDHIKEFYKIKSDNQLAQLLEISPPELSRFRTGQKRPTARLILAVYDMTKMPIEKIRSML